MERRSTSKAIKSSLQLFESSLRVTRKQN